MPVHPNVRICTHIKVTGVRCGSPALRGEQFCYFHQRMVRGVSTPPGARLHPIALLENEEAIQASLMEVINALIRNTVDLKRAELILRALHIAVRNARRVHFNIHESEMVREVPTYPAAPKPAPARVEPTQIDPSQVPTPDLARVQVGTAALGCPGGPDTSGRNAVAPAPDPTGSKPRDTVDLTRRKPPARAGLPATKVKAAVATRAAKWMAYR